MIAEFFTKASSEAWVGLSGVVFGSLLTTLGVWLTNNSNAKRLAQQLEHEERLSGQKLQKERLEELYVLVSEWGNLFFGQFLQLRLVMNGHVDYNEYNEKIGTGKYTAINFNRMSMIINFYGFDLVEEYEDVLRARDAYNEIEYEHKEAYRRGVAGFDFVKPASEAQLRIGAACEDFKLAIARVARGDHCLSS